MKAVINTFATVAIATGFLAAGIAMTASTAEAGPRDKIHDILEDVDLSGTGFIKRR